MSFQRSRNILSKPYVWCFTTYFAEGFPYTLIRMVASVFFRDMHVSLQSIGLTSLYGLPWTIKFLWAPHVDEFSSKRTWMLITQALLGLLFLATGVAIGLPNGVTLAAMLFLAGSFIAATHDTAIDGYYLEALDKAGQARFVGYRVMAYRIAMITGTGLVVTIGATVGWQIAYCSAGALLLLLFAYHLVFLPKREVAERSGFELFKWAIRPVTLLTVTILSGFLYSLWSFVNSNVYKELIRENSFLKGFSFAGWIGVLLILVLVGLVLMRTKIKKALFKNDESFFSKAFISFTDRDHIGLVLLFIIFIRSGEYLLSSMVAPFFVDLGLKVHYGWITGGVGLPCSIVGALAGGWAISKFSLRKVLWPFLLAQNLTNILYMIMAFLMENYVAVNTGSTHLLGMKSTDLLLVASVHGFDQFAGGLGTAVLMTFLMSICSGEYKAAHFAIGTGLMNLSGLVTGVASGFLAASVGYGWFFGASFLVSIPGMFFAFLVVRAGSLNSERDEIERKVTL